MVDLFHLNLFLDYLNIGDPHTVFRFSFSTLFKKLTVLLRLASSSSSSSPFHFVLSAFSTFRSLARCPLDLVRGVDATSWPNCNPPCGVAQGDLLIPFRGSAVGVDGGGVEQKEGNGSGTS